MLLRIETSVPLYQLETDLRNRVYCAPLAFQTMLEMHDQKKRHLWRLRMMLSWAVVLNP
jgi:hypothetical protein